MNGKTRAFIKMTLAGGVLLAGGGMAAAQSLEEALAITYQSNPTLAGARVNLRGVDEGVPQAKAGWRPRVTLSGAAGYIDATTTSGNNAQVSGDSFPLTGRLTVNQTLLDGGRTDALVRRAENNVELERARLFLIESQVLLSGIRAYLEVIRQQSTLALRVKNVARLSKQLEASRDRFQVGEVTKTDVAQAESRLASAKSARAVAQSDLSGARLEFERFIGQAPAGLTQPTAPADLPQSRDEAVQRGLESNFNLARARLNEVQAELTLDAVTAEFFPRLALVAQGQVQRNTGGGDNRSETLSVEAQVTVPLYQAGGLSARTRAAKERINQARIGIEEMRREITDRVASAYESWTASLTQIESLQAAVKAAEIALDGVNQEATVGARTVLDTLDAEQELLGAQVSLVSAERNSLLIAFQLLNEMGELTAARLKLPVELYDYDSHFRAVRDLYWGTDTPE
ncbi:MAG: TolC family outer membrane protein [Pseudomonadota bacterium]|nr:TolC family outer membrane protein [Pseudomonadota bacterium]